MKYKEIAEVLERDIRNIQTICGLTQAALWRFRCWGLQQAATSFWREVAERL